MGQITRTVAERPNVDFDGILDMYRKDLITRNVHSLELRVDSDWTDLYTTTDFRSLWPLYDVTSVRVLKVEDGYGRHEHDEDCRYDGKSDLSCLRHYDDSDWIVTLEYDALPQYGQNRTHQAVYGVIDGIATLWMD